MNRRKNVFETLKGYIPDKSKDDIIESRSEHVITSAIHLMESIDDNYSEEEAELLKKRLLSSIKCSDPKRFSRGIKKVKESRDK